MRDQTRAQFLLTLAGSLAGPPVVTGAPRLTPVDENGYPRVIASRKGRIVLADFWATWCSPCRKKIPELVRLASRLRGRGLDLVMVSADEPEQEPDALKLLREFGAPMPAYIRRASDDDRFIRAVDAKWSGALPALFLYDRAGRAVKSWIGDTPVAEVETAVRQLL